MLVSPSLFNLPDCAVDAVRQAESTIVLVAHTVAPQATCPSCGHPATRVHSRYVRTPHDLPVGPHAVRLLLHVRRFFCDCPACPRRTFAERLPDFLPVKAQRTHRFTHALQTLGFALGGHAGARTGHQLRVSVSPDTVLRALHQTARPAQPPPRVLGVDDFALRKGHTYGTLLVDLERRRPVDVLPDRSADTLATWLRAHPGVDVIARDRSTEYARGASAGAPNAVQVADRWHILKNHREALERMLNRLHADLTQLPEPPSDGSAPTPPTAVRPLRLPSLREQAARQAARDRRAARDQQVQALAQQGVSMVQIAARLGMGRATVRTFVEATVFPERAIQRRQPRMLDPYVPYLQQRWEAGCTNASQLWREIQAQGYPGGRKQVARWVQQHRSAPAPTGPKKYRRRTAIRPQTAEDSARTNTATTTPLALVAPRHLVWLLLSNVAEFDAEDKATFTRIQQHPQVARAQALAQEFQAMVRQRRPAALDSWLAACLESGIIELQNFATGLQHEYASMHAALSEPWSTGQVEGQITRVKLLKRQMYGRAKFDLLKQRVLQRA